MHPGWVKNPAGLLIRSVQDPARARIIRRQFRYDRLKARRARDAASKTAKTEATNAPEPLQIDFRELLEEYQELFRELPHEAQERIHAFTATEGAENRDRAFIMAVGIAIREARNVP